MKDESDSEVSGRFGRKPEYEPEDPNEKEPKKEGPKNVNISELTTKKVTRTEVTDIRHENIVRIKRINRTIYEGREEQLDERGRFVQQPEDESEEPNDKRDAKRPNKLKMPYFNKREEPESEVPGRFGRKPEDEPEEPIEKRDPRRPKKLKMPDFNKRDEPDSEVPGRFGRKPEYEPENPNDKRDPKRPNKLKMPDFNKRDEPDSEVPGRFGRKPEDKLEDPHDNRYPKRPKKLKMPDFNKRDEPESEVLGRLSRNPGDEPVEPNEKRDPKRPNKLKMPDFNKRDEPDLEVPGRFGRKPEDELEDPYDKRDPKRPNKLKMLDFRKREEPESVSEVKRLEPGPFDRKPKEGEEPEKPREKPKKVIIPDYPGRVKLIPVQQGTSSLFDYPDNLLDQEPKDSRKVKKRHNDQKLPSVSGYEPDKNKGSYNDDDPKPLLNDGRQHFVQVDTSGTTFVDVNMHRLSNVDRKEYIQVPLSKDDKGDNPKYMRGNTKEEKHVKKIDVVIHHDVRRNSEKEEVQDYFKPRNEQPDFVVRQSKTSPSKKVHPGFKWVVKGSNDDRDKNNRKSTDESKDVNDQRDNNKEDIPYISERDSAQEKRQPSYKWNVQRSSGPPKDRESPTRSRVNVSVRRVDVPIRSDPTENPRDTNGLDNDHQIQHVDDNFDPTQERKPGGKWGVHDPRTDRNPKDRNRDSNQRDSQAVLPYDQDKRDMKVDFHQRTEEYKYGVQSQTTVQKTYSTSQSTHIKKERNKLPYSQTEHPSSGTVFVNVNENDQDARKDRPPGSTYAKVNKGPNKKDPNDSQIMVHVSHDPIQGADWHHNETSVQEINQGQWQKTQTSEIKGENGEKITRYTYQSKKSVSSRKQTTITSTGLKNSTGAVGNLGSPAALSYPGNASPDDTRENGYSDSHAPGQNNNPGGNLHTGYPGYNRSSRYPGEGSHGAPGNVNYPGDGNRNPDNNRSTGIPGDRYPGVIRNDRYPSGNDNKGHLGSNDNYRNPGSNGSDAYPHSRSPGALGNDRPPRDNDNYRNPGSNGSDAYPHSRSPGALGNDRSSHEYDAYPHLRSPGALGNDRYPRGNDNNRHPGSNGSGAYPHSKSPGGIGNDRYPRGMDNNGFPDNNRSTGNHGFSRAPGNVAFPSGNNRYPSSGFPGDKRNSGHPGGTGPSGYPGNTSFPVNNGNPSTSRPSGYLGRAHPGVDDPSKAQDSPFDIQSLIGRWDPQQDETKQLQPFERRVSLDAKDRNAPMDDFKHKSQTYEDVLDDGTHVKRTIEASRGISGKPGNQTQVQSMREHVVMSKRY